MPLEVIDIGYPRTGTDSLKTALNILGYKTHHMKVIAEEGKNGDKTFLYDWLNLVGGDTHQNIDWDEIYRDYNAGVDAPTSGIYWKNILKFYPEAKIILTLHPRGEEAWANSVYDTIFQFTSFGNNIFTRAFIKKFGPKLMKDFRNVVYGHFYCEFDPKDTNQFDKSTMIKFYQNRIKEAKEIIPEKNLLIFKATDGWEPLCKFLEKPQPNQPYPRVNDREEFRKQFVNKFFFLKIFLIIVAILNFIVFYTFLNYLQVI